jgi:NADH-quinone oxidoreductase subunit H
MTSVYAECNRLPFDLPEAEQELVGGYHTEYNSFGFALFAMGEYTHMITTSFLMSIAFFGGWHFPGLSDIGGLIGVLIKFGILGAKATIFLLLFQLVRWTIPRFRFDQLMGLAWQVLIPLSILNLLAVMIVREFKLPIWVMTVISSVLFLSAALASTKDSNKPRRRVIKVPSEPREVMKV